MQTLNGRPTALLFAGLLVALIGPVACSSSVGSDDGASGDSAVTAYPEGALINVSMESTVGVLLDEL